MFGDYDRFLFIDESGNLGKQGRYFVIALIETCNSKKLHRDVKKTLLRIKTQFPKTKKGSHEIKATHANGISKDFFIRNVYSNDTKISYIVLDKNNLEPRFLEDKNRAYNYLLKLLLDNLGFKRGESFFIGLDNKTVKVSSLNSFEDYINIHFNYELCINAKIKVMYIDSDSGCGYSVQAADYVASFIWAKYEYGDVYYYNMLNSHMSKRLRFPLSSFGI